MTWNDEGFVGTRISFNILSVGLRAIFSAVVLVSRKNHSLIYPLQDISCPAVSNIDSDTELQLTYRFIFMTMWYNQSFEYTVNLNP